ncbi:hypothetical protein L198_01239 [Cryptococcus wingfieldii CBS 7118]|uniref:Uncharacterized protein n=1 Tax=Cryptococcus wingfieldii CBS 7118 TaxID=1295528 RepID=A0A1E3K583_9TREE|nr:hypothetical protein L198_01239 [Cryptococcus wingfieldii CBS 7118]ODO07657.1 hypothetical protein L198_01239 [Cryptococcus wingfieldii CBS 7118]
MPASTFHVPPSPSLSLPPFYILHLIPCICLYSHGLTPTSPLPPRPSSLAPPWLPLPLRLPLLGSSSPARPSSRLSSLFPPLRPPLPFSQFSLLSASRPFVPALPAATSSAPWIYDTGAGQHMTGDASWVEGVCPPTNPTKDALRTLYESDSEQDALCCTIPPSSPPFELGSDDAAAVHEPQPAPTKRIHSKDEHTPKEHNKKSRPTRLSASKTFPGTLGSPARVKRVT